MALQSGGAGGREASTRISWWNGSRTLRARFGAAVTPHALVYVTGGAAVAGLVTAGMSSATIPGGNPTTNSFKNMTINGGWTVGGGIEARLCGNWTGKIEYLYINLGSMTTNMNNQQNMTLTARFNSRHHRQARSERPSIINSIERKSLPDPTVQTGLVRTDV